MARIIFALLGLVGLVISVAVLGGVVLTVMATRGGPGACGGVERSPDLAASFQRKWDGFIAQLEAGRRASVTFSEAELTSRGLAFLDEEDVSVGDLAVCLEPGQAEASGTVEVPFIPDVDVKVRGTLDLTGATPKVIIDKMDVGDLPGFVNNWMEGAIQRVANEALEDLRIEHRYQLEFRADEVLIEGEP